MNKPLIRQKIRLKRQSLNSAQQSMWAKTISSIFLNSFFYQQSKHIACYLPFNGEVNTQTIINQIWQDKKHCYLPVLHTNGQDFMDFYAYKPTDQLQKNHYNILEPPADPHKLIKHNNLDLVLLPLVAFDNNGTRLGMGKGYYDHAFFFTKEKSSFEAPKLLGLAYEFQRVPELPTDLWDVPLTAIITEDGLSVF